MEISLRRLTESGTFANEVLFLAQKKSYTVGRKSHNDIQLKSPNVSRTHCIFHHKSDGIFVEILKCKKCLRVNGVKQEKGSTVLLNHEDIIDIGDEFKYELIIKPPDIFGLQSENQSIETERHNFNEQLLKNEMVELEVQNQDLVKFCAEKTSIKLEQDEPLSSENGIPEPSIGIVKSEPDHDPEQNDEHNYQSMDISDLDAAMQIEVEEYDSKSLLLPLVDHENSRKHEKNDTSQNLILESDLNKNIFENRIKIENPDLPSTNLTLFAKENTENDNFSLENENLELITPSVNETIEMEFEEEYSKPILPLEFEATNFTAELNLENINTQSSNVSKPLLRIRKDLCMNTLEPTIQNHLQPTESENSFPNQSDRVKEEIVDSSNEIHNFRVNEERVDILNHQSLGIRVKKERINPDESSEVRFLEERQHRKRKHSSSEVEVKQENIEHNQVEATDENISTLIKRERNSPIPLSKNIDQNQLEVADENISIPVERERYPPVSLSENIDKNQFEATNENTLIPIKRERDSPVPLSENIDQNQLQATDENISTPVKSERDSLVPSDENIERIKQEIECQSPMNYSQIVSDDIEFYDEKPPPPTYNALNLLTTDASADLSDCTDCSTDNYDETAEKEVPEFKSIRDIKKMTVEELQEYKRKLQNSKIFEKNANQEEIEKFLFLNFERREESPSEEKKRKKSDFKSRTERRDEERRRKKEKNDKKRENMRDKERKKRKERETERDSKTSESIQEKDISKGKSPERKEHLPCEETAISESLKNNQFQNEPPGTSDRNYVGARVLNDYEEERGRTDVDRTKKGEKVKLKYSEYKKRKEMAEKSQQGRDPTLMYPTSGRQRIQERLQVPRIIQSATSEINDLRMQPQYFDQRPRDPRIQGRPQPIVNQDPRWLPSFPVPSTSAIHERAETSRDPRALYRGNENGVQTFMEPRSSFEERPKDPRLSARVESQVTKNLGSTKDRDELRNSEVQKSKMVNRTEKRNEIEEERRKKKKSIKEKDKFVITGSLESDDMADEMLVTIFSWDPALFEKGKFKSETPIPELRNVRKTALSYLNYDTYCYTFFNILLLDVSIQIQEAFPIGGEKSTLEKCTILPNIDQKIMIKGTESYLVPFYVKINVPIFEDSKPPEVGDLLQISVLDEKAKRSIIFGYIKKINNEEPTESRVKLVTYLVSIKQQEFDIHKCKIQNIIPVLNLISTIKKAKAIYHLRESPLLPCIMRPNPDIDCSEPAILLSQDELFYQKTFDRKQLTAVSKILQSFRHDEPNICVVEGTAGTGKTSIIVNTILHLLCTKKFKFQKDNLRILVCASTNTELNEIIIKLNNAIDLLKIGKEVIKMVIVGPDDGRRKRTKALSLSNLARNHVEGDVHRYQESIGLKPMEEQGKIIEEEMKRLSEKFKEKKCVHVALQMSLLNQYFIIGKSGRKVKQMTHVEKKEMLDLAEFTYLAGANLIFSSIQNLTCSVMKKFREKHVIPVCIVDEAAQIVEMDTLKVLAFRGKTLVLLGDIYKHSTIYEHSPRLRSLGWENSLFNRIVDNFANCQKSPIVNLITQYRIVPRIEKWLMRTKSFGVNTIRNLVVETIPFPLHPLCIFNLQHTEDFVDNEAVFASSVIHCIANFGNLRRMERIISVGVILSDIEAKERVEQDIKNRLEEIIPGKRQLLNIEVDTIDGFLNHEKDIVLASCMRNKHLCCPAGFSRFYYTLSRAKHCLIIYGRFARVGKFKGSCEWHKFVDSNEKNVVNVSVYGESTELRRDLIK